MSLRVCDICGKVDNLPRHIISHAPGDAPAVHNEVFVAVIADPTLSNDTKASVVAALGDTTLEIRHIACCAGAGCPAGSCTKD